MPTPIETTTAVQDKILSSIQVSQKAVLDTVKSWAETVEVLSSALPKVAFDDPKPTTDLLESTLDFNKKLLASQREFVAKVYEAAMPAASAPASAAAAAKPKP